MLGKNFPQVGHLLSSEVILLENHLYLGPHFLRTEACGPYLCTHVRTPSSLLVCQQTMGTPVSPHHSGPLTLVSVLCTCRGASWVARSRASCHHRSPRSSYCDLAFCPVSLAFSQLLPLLFVEWLDLVGFLFVCVCLIRDLIL